MDDEKKVYLQKISKRKQPFGPSPHPCPAGMDGHSGCKHMASQSVVVNHDKNHSLFSKIINC
jgi:hypothetical protein